MLSKYQSSAGAVSITWQFDGPVVRRSAVLCMFECARMLAKCI